LAQGKTPYSIGKELADWVEKLFETNIPVNTLKDRAYRMQKKIGGNQPKHETLQNHSEIPEKQENQQVAERQQEPGPGRPAKYAPEPKPWSCAMQGRGKITS
jgi:hypothetical protein